MNATLVRVLGRAQASRGRLAFAGIGGGLLVLVALIANAGTASPRVVAGLIANAGFAFVVPVVTLLFAVACLGDLVEDGTLVYVWLRPVSRLSLGLSAVVSTLLAAGVPVVGALALASVLGGRVDVLLPAVVAGALGVGAYGALFVALGLRTTRSLLWGLAYALLWEGVASNITLAFARLSLRRYTASLFTDLAGTGDVPHPTSAGHAAVVLVLVTVAGTALTVWFLRRADVT